MELDPRIQRFQAIKAQEKARAIRRKGIMDQIRARNPGASDMVMNQLYEAHIKAQTFGIIKVEAQGKKSHKVLVQRI